MAVIGFTVMTPIATMAMIDTARWRPVVYADTPRSLARYEQFLTSKKDGRKVALFLFGASYLNTVLANAERFTSILVFDDVQNLHGVRAQVDGFEIVDVEKNNGLYPKYLSPQELAVVLDAPTKMPENVLLKNITNALGPRRPSVLETTSRVPMPEAVPMSGAQRKMAEIKAHLEATEGCRITFAEALDVYAKYLFRIVDRNYVTQNVTKKLPTSAKETLWKAALDFADSGIGLAMTKAFHSLCRASDPDYRAGHAVTKFGLKAYSGDFLYFTSLLPPHKTCTFLPGTIDNDNTDDKPLIQVMKVAAPEPKHKKSRAKAARARA